MIQPPSLRPYASADEPVLARVRGIRCVVFDIDGVMTTNQLWFDADYVESKDVNVRDGLGMKMLRHHGVEIGVISGRPSPAMARRLASLGLKHVWLGHEHKLGCYEELKVRLGLTDPQMAMMGDDIVDLPLMRRVGFALCPADAHPLATAAAHWVSLFPGGRGAIREATDLIIGTQTGLGLPETIPP